ncbi:MAG: SDR family NAD(P)-dependent oxidoreductase [Ferrovibrionaceae bacterium]
MAYTLENKVAVVVGGSGGIGAATALALAGAGARVVVTWRADRAGAEALAARLPGVGHLALQADVADSTTLNVLAGTVAERCGRADILVNAAGFTAAVPAHDLDALDDDLIDRLFQVNWRGCFATIRAFRPLLAASGDGLIVNISSIAGMTGAGSNLAYAAAKAGIDALTKGLARALAPAIRVVAVSPGMVDTAFVPGRDAAANAKAAQTIPLRRVADPADVADAVLACATLLRYSTGTIVVSDGGRSL